MYRKFGQPKWILIGQMLKLVGKCPMAHLFLALQVLIGGKYRMVLYYDTKDNVMAHCTHYGKGITLFGCEFRWLHMTIHIPGMCDCYCSFT